jgi:hypothetical protein
MERIDSFTRKRMERFVEEFRARSGQLPTLSDLADHGFDKDKVEDAIHDHILSEFYVTLTNGMVKKGYKLYQAP